MASVPVRVFWLQTTETDWLTCFKKKGIYWKIISAQKLGRKPTEQSQIWARPGGPRKQEHRRSLIIGIAGSEPLYKQRPKTRARETLFLRGSELARLTPELKFSVPILFFNGTQPVQNGT